MSRAVIRYLARHHWGLIATFIALGGTAYAAGVLPRASVGTAQLKQGAVTFSKLSRQTQAALRSMPSKGYYAASMFGNPVASSSLGPGLVGVVIHVPAGKYIVHGGCTAGNTANLGAPLSFSSAGVWLWSDQNAPILGETTSVPTQGSTTGTGLLTLGTAALAASAGFTLPNAGTITVGCQSASISAQNIYLTAERVASLN